MEIYLIILTVVVILCFLISTITDIILFRKLFKTKGIVLATKDMIIETKDKIIETNGLTLVNNREIHEHDREIFNIQEQLEEIKNG